MVRRYAEICCYERRGATIRQREAGASYVESEYVDCRRVTFATSADYTLDAI